MTHKISRRRFLRALSLTGISGVVAFHPLSSAARTVLQSPPTLTETRLLMGTLVNITVADSSRAHMEDAIHAAFARMDTLIPLFDRHTSSSVVSVLNAQGSLRDIPQELSTLLTRTRAISALTNGAFNATVQPLVDLFREYATCEGVVPIPDPALTEARALVSSDGRSGWNTRGKGVVLEHTGMGLTLDGIAKGHIADLVSRELIRAGAPNHLINAGGDIMASGEKAPGIPWQVAIANPSSPHTGSARYGRSFPLCNAALATSGNYEIYYDAERRHHHLINASTGSSPLGTISASVMASSVTDADALATALSVMEPHNALTLVAELPDCECLLIGRNGSILKSRGWPV